MIKKNSYDSHKILLGNCKKMSFEENELPAETGTMGHNTFVMTLGNS